MNQTTMETKLPEKISTASIEEMMKMTGQAADMPATTSKGYWEQRCKLHELTKYRPKSRFDGRDSKAIYM